jgi:hypothetical protein
MTMFLLRKELPYSGCECGQASDPPEVIGVYTTYAKANDYITEFEKVAKENNWMSQRHLFDIDEVDVDLEY